MAVDYAAVGVLVGDESHTLKGTESIYTLSTIVGTATYTLAAATARSIAADFAGAVDKKAADVSISASQKFDHYTKLAAQLERQAGKFSLGATSVYAGGISQSDKATREDNSDRVEPYFTRTLQDDPGRDDDSEYA